jgi:hypothetical protein
MRSSDIMIDIETLGTTPGCVIISIGACTFSPTDGTAGCQTFYDRIDISDAVGAGLAIEPDTVIWWLVQDADSRAELTRTDGRSTLSDALDNLGEWFTEIGANPETQVWANGASFDFPILEAAYRAVHKAPPWNYRQLRCYRTARKILPSIEELTPQGIKHHALCDAHYQARVLSAILTRVRELETQCLSGTLPK